MTPPEPSGARRLAPLGLALALLLVGAGAAAAVTGWAEHGDTIFLTLASGGWVNCF